MNNECDTELFTVIGAYHKTRGAQHRKTALCGCKRNAPQVIVTRWFLEMSGNKQAT